MSYSHSHPPLSRLAQPRGGPKGLSRGVTWVRKTKTFGIVRQPDNPNPHTALHTLFVVPISRLLPTPRLECFPERERFRVRNAFGHEFNDGLVGMEGECGRVVSVVTNTTHYRTLIGRRNGALVIALYLPAIGYVCRKVKVFVVGDIKKKNFPLRRSALNAPWVLSPVQPKADH